MAQRKEDHDRHDVRVPHGVRGVLRGEGRSMLVAGKLLPVARSQAEPHIQAVGHTQVGVEHNQVEHNQVEHNQVEHSQEEQQRVAANEAWQKVREKKNEEGEEDHDGLSVDNRGRLHNVAVTMVSMVVAR